MQNNCAMSDTLHGLQCVRYLMEKMVRAVQKVSDRWTNKYMLRLYLQICSFNCHHFQILPSDLKMHPHLRSVALSLAPTILCVPELPAGPIKTQTPSPSSSCFSFSRSQVEPENSAWTSKCTGNADVVGLSMALWGLLFWTRLRSLRCMLFLKCFLA